MTSMPRTGRAEEGPSAKEDHRPGPIFGAAAAGRPCDGECNLDLGQAAGTYLIHAVPLWTPTEERGANGENAVAAIIRPLNVRKPKKKSSTPAGASLFDQ